MSVLGRGALLGNKMCLSCSMLLGAVINLLL